MRLPESIRSAYQQSPTGLGEGGAALYQWPVSCVLCPSRLRRFSVFGFCWRRFVSPLQGFRRGWGGLIQGYAASPCGSWLTLRYNMSPRWGFGFEQVDENFVVLDFRYNMSPLGASDSRRWMGFRGARLPAPSSDSLRLATFSREGRRLVLPTPWARGTICCNRLRKGKVWFKLSKDE